MKIRLVTPAPRGSRVGNRITANRWAAILRELGHEVIVEREYTGGNAELLIALHARKSHPSIARFRRALPGVPVVLALTGTDLYRDLRTSVQARHSVEWADALVVLQPLAARELPRAAIKKMRVVYQSVPEDLFGAEGSRGGMTGDARETVIGGERGTTSGGGRGNKSGEHLPARAPTPGERAHARGAKRPEPTDQREARRRDERGRSITVCVLGHLRPVKDPFRAALAVRRLPASSGIRVVHVGRALSPEMERRALAEMARNPRYVWVGEKSRAEALRLLARSDVMVLSSISEGGANAISEAAVCGVPVLASRIPGSIGLLGDEYPGYFPVRDTAALTMLLLSFEREPAFAVALRRRVHALRSKFSPSAERSAWRRLLKDVEARRAPADTGRRARRPRSPHGSG